MSKQMGLALFAFGITAWLAMVIVWLIAVFGIMGAFYIVGCTVVLGGSILVGLHYWLD